LTDTGIVFGDVSHIKAH